MFEYFWQSLYFEIQKAVKRIKITHFKMKYNISMLLFHYYHYLLFIKLLYYIRYSNEVNYNELKKKPFPCIISNSFYEG